MTQFNDFLLGPNRAVTDAVRVEYYSGGPEDKLGAAVLLRASGRAAEDDGADQVKILIERHLVLSYTACGAWIDTWAGKRFVNLRANKQWASTTEEEAVDQLWYRKRVQVRILTSRLDEARKVESALIGAFGKRPPSPRRPGRTWPPSNGSTGWPRS